MFFKIIGRISDVETIALGKAVRERRRLRKLYGGQRWRKLKGTAAVKLADGTMCYAEVHWYELTALAQESSRSNAFWKSNEAN
jgi:hypothetical protein